MKSVEPSDELKELNKSSPSPLSLEGAQVSASDAEKVLHQDAQLRANQAAQECRQICEKYRVDIIAQVMIQGNQIQSQVVFTAKK